MDWLFSAIGLTSSTPEQKKISQQQQDIKYLGDRNPFGDHELLHIYRAYHARLGLAKENKQTSFLQDIGILCYSAGKDEGIKEERTLILQAVESKILPPNFGNTLYQTSFLRSKELSDYDSSFLAPPEGFVDDDFTRQAKLEAFFDGVSNSGRRGAKKALNIFVQACKQYPSTDNDPAFVSPQHVLIDPTEFVDMGYRVALAAAFLDATSKDDDEDVGRFLPGENISNHPDLKALVISLKAFATRRKQWVEQSAMPSSKLLSFVSAEDIFEWGEHVAPMLAASLASLIHQICFPRRPPPPSRSTFEFPQLSHESAFFDTPSCPLLFSFACMSPSLSGEFYRLYTSASDGLSFNRLQNALLGYGGPTLLIIRAMDDSIFGAYTSSAWKESKDFYGNTDCFLFQILPSTSVIRPSGNGENFMYCNSYARSRGYDKQAHGIGFGGSVHEPRLFIAESFDNCQAAPADLTFEKGHLLSEGSGGGTGKEFEIDSLEVWGVGGTEMVMEALGARTKQRDIRQAAINKARKVDKAAFLEDFQSGLLESKAFAHRTQIQGRDGACIGEDEMNEHAKQSVSQLSP